jgi:hypothetical protein
LNGFEMKSHAPSREASTAASSVPKPVTRMTGAAPQLAQDVEPRLRGFEVDVADDQVEILAPGEFERALRLLRALGLPPLRRENLAEQRTRRRVVINHENLLRQTLPPLRSFETQQRRTRLCVNTRRLFFMAYVSYARDGFRLDRCVLNFRTFFGHSREDEAEARAAPSRRLDLDAPAVIADDLADDDQA